MDIRNWSLDQIMQLPDCAFGRRWPVGLGTFLLDEVPKYDICEAALPEVCILWELSMFVAGTVGTTAGITLALGDALPTTEAEFDALELVFSGIVSSTPRRGEVEQGSHSSPHVFTIRQPVAAAGRRFVGRIARRALDASAAQVDVIISSIPTEVPDWLISGPGRSL